LLGEAAQGSEAGDQQQVRKTAEEQAEEAVEIARDKPARFGALSGLDRARDEGVLVSWLSGAGFSLRGYAFLRLTPQAEARAT